MSPPTYEALSLSPFVLVPVYCQHCSELALQQADAFNEAIDYYIEVFKLRAWTEACLIVTQEIGNAPMTPDPDTSTKV